MPKRPARARDPNQLAALVVRIAMGEEKNIKPAAPKAGKRKGGVKGGKARARRLTAEERREIARTAAVARWKR